MNWWLWIKARSVAVGALILAFLAAVFRHKQVVHQRDKAKEEARRLKAVVEMQKRVNEADSEIDAEYSHRAAVANEDKRDGKVPSNLGSPNDF